MRQPTPRDELYAFHSAALRGEKQQLTANEAHPGWYRRRLVQSRPGRPAPWVPVIIWMEQPIDPDTGELIGPERLRCRVNGVDRDALDQWIWVCDQPISEAEFAFMTDTASWATKHAPDHPAANPGVQIDLLTVKPPF